jgi:hypothetical protein
MRVSIGEKTVNRGSAWGTFEHEYLSRQLFLAGTYCELHTNNRPISSY